jgi:hypothetical protein
MNYVACPFDDVSVFIEQVSVFIEQVEEDVVVIGRFRFARGWFFAWSRFGLGTGPGFGCGKLPSWLWGSFLLDRSCCGSAR